MQDRKNFPPLVHFFFCKYPYISAVNSEIYSPSPFIWFLQDDYTVNLIGYRGAEVISELQAPLAAGTVTLNYIPDL